MNHFPVTSSILSSGHLNLFLRKTYDLSDLSKCSLVKAGINHSYLVADGNQKYIFRIYSLNWRTKDEISEEIRFIDHLRKNQIPVSFALADTNGNYIQNLNAPEGARFGVLFTYAKGEKVMNLSDETHFRIGTLMATLHNKSMNFKLNRPEFTHQSLILEPYERIHQFITEDCEEIKFLADTRNFLLDELQKVDIKQIRQGVVHLDIWFDNMSITPESEMTIFDFDFCGNGWLSLDIAYYLMQLFVIENETDYLRKKESFLKGYESITTLSHEEKRILPLLSTSIYYFYMGVHCQRFENWSNVFLNETYIKKFIMNRVKRYSDYSMKTASVL